jgi:alkane 1-monooxygenase
MKFRFGKRNAAESATEAVESLPHRAIDDAVAPASEDVSALAAENEAAMEAVMAALGGATADDMRDPPVPQAAPAFTGDLNDAAENLDKEDKNLDKTFDPIPDRPIDVEPDETAHAEVILPNPVPDAAPKAPDPMPAIAAAVEEAGKPDVTEEPPGRATAGMAGIVAFLRPGPGWAGLRSFAVATLAPVPLLVLGAFFGGVFAFLAVLYLTAFTFALDRVLKPDGGDGRAPGQTGERLMVTLAITHFALLLIGVYALSGAAGLGFWGWILVFLGFGLWFGQVSNSNGHELIHRGDKRLHRLGMWVFISLLFGHHTSAHRLVHHRFVATPDDPNTAEEGEGFYDFLARAWTGSFLAGYEIERVMMRAGLGSKRRRLNPYVIYVGGAAGFALFMLVAFGVTGLLAYLLLCGHAQLQLLLSDYVQHYGLLRPVLADGRRAPVQPQHSWDAPQVFSGWQLLHAPRHSDHHAHPAKPFPALQLDPEGRAPMLPYAVPVMATIALAPTLWRRIMDPRLAAAKAHSAGVSA